MKLPKSESDFINNLTIVEEELDETLYFYELLAEFNADFKIDLRDLSKEANQLLAITVSSISTAVKNLSELKLKKSKS